MKRWLAGAAICFCLGAAAWRLSVRAREESADCRLTLLVDWSEARDAFARLGLSNAALLQKLHDAGAQGLLISASTVQDYLFTDSRFLRREEAEVVLGRLADRGVQGLSLKAEGQAFRIVSPQADLQRLKDVEAGFNPRLLEAAREAGFRLILRINHDPWLAKDRLFADLVRISGEDKIGVLLNTDEIPGGQDALPEWKEFLRDSRHLQLYFEFHPAKSTLKLGYAVPEATWRAHTIPSNELKDLIPSQQAARWRRAVEERSCRFLLVHVSPNDSLATFLAGLSSLHDSLLAQRWAFAWPEPRRTWKIPSALQRLIAPPAAFLVAIITPILALRTGLRKKSYASFVRILAISLIGASLTAALADNPWTRIEVVPFRGVRLAFALGWFGCFILQYSWEEWEAQLIRSIRRVDILTGLVAAAIVAYVLIRMGNASAAWKPGWEQGIRDRLEALFVARPRFKEFAVGYPLLLLGLHIRSRAKVGTFWHDGRFLIAVGMIGPVSLVNTFCHLHSPLYLAFWRSVNGILIGTLLGLLLIIVKERVEKLL